MDLDKYYKKFENDLLDEFEVSVASALSPSGRSIFSNAKTPRDNSGALAASFSEGAKTKISGGDMKVTFKSNLPYATVHEEGMFIKATPTTDSKGRPTYKMAQYFWGKFSEKQETHFKIIALSVMKKGGVNIKARPYIDKAVKHFEDNGIQRAFDKLTDLVIADFLRGLNE